MPRPQIEYKLRPCWCDGTTLGYMKFLALQSKAPLVITDSGDVQGETTFLGIHCLTVRKKTDRPVPLSSERISLLARIQTGCGMKRGEFFVAARKRGLSRPYGIDQQLNDQETGMS